MSKKKMTDLDETLYENECGAVADEMKERVFVLDENGKSVPLFIPDDLEEHTNA